MKKFLPLIALALLIAAPACAAAPSAKETDDAVNAYLATKSDPSIRETANLIGSTVADLDQDGKDEIVLTWTTMGASYSVDNLGVLAGGPGSYKEAAMLQLKGNGDKPEVKNGAISVPQMTFAKTDPLCCPSVKTTGTYKWDGKSTLTEVK